MFVDVFPLGGWEFKVPHRSTSRVGRVLPSSFALKRAALEGAEELVEFGK